MQDGEVLYRKIKQGKRVIYEPVAQHETFDIVEEGFYLVYIRPGGKSVIHNIKPEYARVEAALRTCSDAMLDAMQEADALRPRNVPITPEQQKAWKKLEKAFGDDKYCLTRESLAVIVSAGIAVVRCQLAE